MPAKLFTKSHPPTEDAHLSAAMDPIPPELVDFAGRMYDAARAGDLDTFRQALPAGLPPNLTNDKGDTLVGHHWILSLQLEEKTGG